MRSRAISALMLSAGSFVGVTLAMWVALTSPDLLSWLTELLMPRIP